MTETIAAEQHARITAFREAQAVLAEMIGVAKDSYSANKGTEMGLVAFGQIVALRGLSERLHRVAAAGIRG